MRSHASMIAATAALAVSIAPATAASALWGEPRLRDAEPTPPGKPSTFKQKVRQAAKARARKRHRRIKHGVR